MRVRAIVAAVVLVVAGCGKDSPSGPGGVGGRLLRTLAIEGPASIAPGATVQLRVIGRFNDGTEQDMTARASWTSREPDIVAMTPSGSATGGSVGECTIQADFEGNRITRVLLVLPPNTWKISGSVTDGGFAIENARVEVVSGTGAGAAATTTAAGLFALYGVAGELQLRVTADGYLARTRDVGANGTQHIGTIVLQPAFAPVDVSGAWTLTIDAAENCGNLPDFARRRSYVATLQQSGTFLQIRLEGANTAAGTFTGRVAANEQIRFDLLDPYYRMATIAERIDISQYTVGGEAVGRAAPSSITATLSGDIVVQRQGQARLACGSLAHQLTFVRR